MLARTGNRYPWHLMQEIFSFGAKGIATATEAAMKMHCVKATIVPKNHLGMSEAP